MDELCWRFQLLGGFVDELCWKKWFQLFEPVALENRL